MNPPESKRLFFPRGAGNFFYPLVLAVLICSGGGCMVSPHKTLFTVGDSAWTVREGQVLWRPGSKYPELAGEIVMAKRADGACSIQFTKTLLPVMLAQTTSNQWLIQFPPRQLGFAGRGKPPRRFSWLYLSAALAGEKLPYNFNFARHPGGGWRLENSRTGETLDGFLGP